MADLKETVAAFLGCDQKEITVVNENLGGGTNRSGLIEYRGKKYIVRLATDRSAELGINYQAEKAAYEAMGDEAYDILYFNTDNGDYIRGYIEGEMLVEELAQPEWVKKVARMLNELHVKRIGYAFNPYKDIVDRFEVCWKRAMPLPVCTEKVLDCYQERVYKRLSVERDNYIGLCHNDPFAGNIILGTDEKLRLIDFEFAGDGDIFFDLACLAWGYSHENRRLLLEYTVGYSEENRHRLYDAVFEAALWNVGWSFVKASEPYETSDYYTNAVNVMGWLDILASQTGLLQI